MRTIGLTKRYKFQKSEGIFHTFTFTTITKSKFPSNLNLSRKTFFGTNKFLKKIHNWAAFDNFYNIESTYKSFGSTLNNTYVSY